MSEIKAEVGANVKTIYCDGEPLGLWGLLVWGTYSSEDVDARYSALITDYELDPPNGTILQANNAVTEQTITVKSGNKTDTIKVTVTPIYTVTFVSDGNVQSIQSVVNGGTAREVNIPKIGYTFGGWYEKTGENYNDESYDFGTIVSDNITLTARWTAHTYQIVFNANGGKWSDDTSADKVISARYQANVPVLENPTREGYTFSGWDENSDNIPDNVDTSFNMAKYYTSVWTTANGISVTIDHTSTIGITDTSTDESIILTAADGFTDYSWKIDGEAADESAVSNEGKTLTVAKLGLTADVVYQISLTAKKSGIPYNARVTVKK